MKKIILIIIATASFTPVFTQQKKTVTPNNSYEVDYMQLSKKQKKTASIMLMGGLFVSGASVLILLNSELGENNLSVKYGLTMGAMTIGGLSVLASIPLFLAAARNEGRAMAGSGGLKIEYRPAIAGAVLSNKPFPAIVLKLDF